MYNLSVFLNNSKIREGDSFLFFKGNFTRVSKKEDKGKEKKKKRGKSMEMRNCFQSCGKIIAYIWWNTYFADE